MSHLKDLEDANTAAIVPTHVGAVSQQQRETAEIQSALTIAAQRPRDTVAAMQRIATACGRAGLAANSVYRYVRGGTEVSGPNVHLIQAIGGLWGNLEWGWRELSTAPGSSLVEAYAWDLETNTKRRIQFTVKHVRETRSGNYPLTDPRDVYENTANLASRRMRACLESILPFDVVEEAVEMCNRTMLATEPVTADRIKALVAAFAEIGVTQDQIAARIQRTVDNIQPAQMLQLRHIYSSIKGGVGRVEDYFREVVPAKADAAGVAAKVAAKAKGRPVADKAPHAAEPAIEKAPQPPATSVSDTEHGDAWEPLDVPSEAEAFRARCRAEFAGRGSNASKSLYDKHCGPDSTLSSDLIGVATEEYERRLSEIAASK